MRGVTAGEERLPEERERVSGRESQNERESTDDKGASLVSLRDSQTGEHRERQTASERRERESPVFINTAARRVASGEPQVGFGTMQRVHRSHSKAVRRMFSRDALECKVPPGGLDLVHPLSSLSFPQLSSRSKQSPSSVRELCPYAPASRGEHGAGQSRRSHVTHRECGTCPRLAPLAATLPSRPRRRHCLGPKVADLGLLAPSRGGEERCFTQSASAR